MQRSPVRAVMFAVVALTAVLGGCGIKGAARPPLPPSPPPTTETPAADEVGRGPFAPSAPPPTDAGIP